MNSWGHTRKMTSSWDLCFAKGVGVKNTALLRPQRTRSGVPQCAVSRELPNTHLATFISYLTPRCSFSALGSRRGASLAAAQASSWPLRSWLRRRLCSAASQEGFPGVFRCPGSPSAIPAVWHLCSLPQQGK